MRRAFLLMAVSAMLMMTLGFAQAPAASGNADTATVKGCLGGSDGNYTVAEDGTRLIFKITTSSVDLKAHLGHEVKLIGHKINGSVSSGTGDNSFAVTELNMISEHCAAAAASTVGAVAPYSQTVIEPTTAAPAPSAPASTPTVDAAAPAATVSPSSAAVSAPAVEAAPPATSVSPSSTPASTPVVETASPAAPVSPSPAAASASAVDAAAPAAPVSPSSAAVSAPAVKAAAPASPSSATVSEPAAEAARAPRPSSHARRLSAAKAAATAAPESPSETASPTAADAGITKSSSPETVSPAAADAATAGPSSEAASAPAAAAPAPTVTHKAGSLSLLIAFVVLVIVFGTLAPLLLRWRKRKILERTGAPNLSFTHEVSSELDKAEPRKVA